MGHRAVQYRISDLGFGKILNWELRTAQGIGQRADPKGLPSLAFRASSEQRMANHEVRAALDFMANGELHSTDFCTGSYGDTFAYDNDAVFDAK